MRGRLDEGQMKSIETKDKRTYRVRVCGLAVCGPQALQRCSDDEGRGYT